MENKDFLWYLVSEMDNFTAKDGLPDKSKEELCAFIIKMRDEIEGQLNNNNE